MTGPLVDAHLHVWDPALGVYAWLTPEAGPLYRAYRPEEAAAQLERAGVTSAVLVQAADSDVESRTLLRAAAAHPWIEGVVGWIDLEDPDGADGALDALRAGEGGEFLCGVRQLVHDDPRVDVLALDDVARTAARLARRGLPLDVPDAHPRQSDGAAILAAAQPDLTIVVDHLGKPPRGTAALTDWERWLRELARHDNVVAKLSGLHTGGAVFSASALAPVVEIALEAFGSRRLMLGSDWPISRAGADYVTTMGVLDGLLAALTSDERDDVRWRTASRVYGLPRPVGG